VLQSALTNTDSDEIFETQSITRIMKKISDYHPSCMLTIVERLD